MAINTPLTDAERERIRELHAKGLGRNKIATALDRGVSTISKEAKRLGLSFDRSAIQAATVASQIDMRAKRTELMIGLIEDANKLRQQMWAPTTIHSFGGKDNTYASMDVLEPLPADKRNLMGAASMAITAALKLDQRDAGTAEQAKSVLGVLAQGLGVAFEALQAQEQAGAGASGDGA